MVCRGFGRREEVETEAWSEERGPRGAYSQPGRRWAVSAALQATGSEFNVFGLPIRNVVNGFKGIVLVSHFGEYFFSGADDIAVNNGGMVGVVKILVLV